MIEEVLAKSILRKHKKIDSWFLTHYGINLYRGCSHNCIYCDGRAESYRVDGDFGKDITVKSNAISLLQRELDPRRKRKPMPKSFMLIGGGVCDAYQSVEKKYELARKTLELCVKFKYPAHVLTKSTLVERDLDLLQKINEQNKTIVSFSFSSADDKISSIFEPGVPSPTKRLETIKKMKDAGMTCGMFLMPIIPFITDKPEILAETIKKGKDAGIDFIIFGSMTLKVGRQKDYFMKVLKKYYPNLLPEYEIIYSQNSKWGASDYEYNKSLNQIFDKIATENNIPKRITPYIYKDIISENDLIIVILEQLDYLLKLKNRKSPYGYAAYSLSKLKSPIKDFSANELLKISGVGEVSLKLIQEIIRTGTCKYYENMMNYKFATA